MSAAMAPTSIPAQWTSDQAYCVPNTGHLKFRVDSQSVRMVSIGEGASMHPMVTAIRERLFDFTMKRKRTPFRPEGELVDWGPRELNANADAMAAMAHDLGHVEWSTLRPLQTLLRDIEAGGRPNIACTSDGSLRLGTATWAYMVWRVEAGQLPQPIFSRGGPLREELKQEVYLAELEGLLRATECVQELCDGNFVNWMGQQMVHKVLGQTPS